MNGLELFSDLEKVELILLAVIRNTNYLCVFLLNELTDAELVHRLLINQIKNSNGRGRLRYRIQLYFSINSENREQAGPSPS